MKARRGHSPLQVGATISVVITVLAGLSVYSPDLYAWLGDQTGYAPPQPVEFSHKVHARDNAIPCQYCHANASRGPVAGLPPASVCMNCHVEIKKDAPEVKKIAAAVAANRPVEWIRVHRMPDFVRFDHSAHVAKGVACQTCHGLVETMDCIRQTRAMSMGWCVNCHRETTAHPPRGMNNVRASVECSACHY
jgi:hypothetical protein